MGPITPAYRIQNVGDKYKYQRAYAGDSLPGWHTILASLSAAAWAYLCLPESHRSPQNRKTEAFIVCRTIWFFWANPLQWAQQSIIINEFSAGHWQTIPAPNGNPRGLGVYTLESRSFHTDYWCGLIPLPPGSCSQIRKLHSSSSLRSIALCL